VSLLVDVLDQARAGVSVDKIPGALGADPGLVDAALDHWTRLGLLVGAADALTPGCGPGCAVPGTHQSAQSLACAGCFFATRR